MHAANEWCEISDLILSELEKVSFRSSEPSSRKQTTNWDQLKSAGSLYILGNSRTTSCVNRECSPCAHINSACATVLHLSAVYLSSRGCGTAGKTMTGIRRLSYRSTCVVKNQMQ